MEPELVKKDGRSRTIQTLLPVRVKWTRAEATGGGAAQECEGSLLHYVFYRYFYEKDTDKWSQLVGKLGKTIPMTEGDMEDVMRAGFTEGKTKYTHFYQCMPEKGRFSLLLPQYAEVIKRLENPTSSGNNDSEQNGPEEEKKDGLPPASSGFRGLLSSKATITVMIGLTVIGGSYLAWRVLKAKATKKSLGKSSPTKLAKGVQKEQSLDEEDADTDRGEVEDLQDEEESREQEFM
jgi:hypothetical protein